MITERNEGDREILKKRKMNYDGDDIFCRTSVSFLVMENVFYPHVSVSRQYDLKGSTFDREVLNMHFPSLSKMILFLSGWR
jgi:hypothetical protein